MQNVFSDIRGGNQNGVGRKSMGGRLPLFSEERWEGKEGRRGMVWKVEGDLHHYTKYMYEDVNWVSTYLYTIRDMINCGINVY